MTDLARSSPCIAIACGGTGGHLFPGLAVGQQLLQRGCRVQLIISPKEVDQQAVRSAQGMGVLTLPAVGLVRGGLFRFATGFWRSYTMARRAFRDQRPDAVLAMGGFTSAPPVLAAKRLGAHTFLHESNTIPGRANRWLSRVVEQAFVGFPTTAERLPCRRSLVTGTPVRAQFRFRAAAEARQALGLAPDLPVMVVVGGSQGARGINELVLQCLSILSGSAASWQWLHVTGSADWEQVKQAHTARGTKGRVVAFLSEMDLALSAATAVVSRAGASSLAEIAATQAPAVLIPYPSATDNHQFFNASAFAESGAAYLLPQDAATPGGLIGLLQRLADDPAERGRMQSALSGWQRPKAAELIAGTILQTLGVGAPEEQGSPQGGFAAPIERRSSSQTQNLTAEAYAARPRTQALQTQLGPQF